MYYDGSSNPITAMDGVEALLGPIQRSLAGGCAPVPGYQYDTSVSLGAYERLAARYDELLAAADHGMRVMRLKSAKQAIEIARLRAELARKG